MNTPHQSSLGREVAYPTGYDPSLLFPIPRAGARAELGLAAGAALHEVATGHDPSARDDAAQLLREIG